MDRIGWEVKSYNFLEGCPHNVVFTAQLANDDISNTDNRSLTYKVNKIVANALRKSNLVLSTFKIAIITITS